MIGTTRWRPLITTVAAEYSGIDPVVFESMILVESNGDPDARSASNAIGLGQIIARWHLPTITRIATERGVTGTADAALRDPEVNLRVSASHLRWCYTSDGSQSWDRAVRKYFTGTADPPPGFQDGQGTTPDQHITKLRAALVTVRADMANNEQDAPMATHTAHTWPGLSKPVYLPDSIPVEVKLITNSRFRSNAKTGGHIRTTWHDTGNPGTNADAEYRWANGGRVGAGVGGYNGIFDDKKVIITQPFDEVVWAAGTAVGNATSYHFEQAWGTGVNFEKSLEVGAAVHGGLIAAKGWTTAGSLVQHNYWYGKDCPGQIRRKGLWPRVVAMVEAARIAALNAASGGTRPDPSGPVYAQPVHVRELEYDTFPPALVTVDGGDFVYVGDMVEATKSTPRLQLAYDGAEKTGKDIEAGEQFPVEWLFKSDDGQWYYLTVYGTRVKYLDTRRISDEVPE